MKRNLAKPEKPNKKPKTSDMELLAKQNVALHRAMTHFAHLKGTDKEDVSREIRAWIKETDACTSAHRLKKGGWVPDFDEMMAKNDNARSASGTRSLLKKPLNPIILCVSQGITVQEQKSKTSMNSAHRVPYFPFGQADRLNSFWIGLCDPQIPPVVTGFPIGTTADPVSTNFVVPSIPPEFVPPIHTTVPEDLRSTVLASEAKSSSLVNELKVFRSMLEHDETRSLCPSTYTPISEKAAVLIILCDAQTKEGVEWTDQKRKSLLCRHAATFVKEGASLVILASWRAKELKTFCAADDCPEWGSYGTEVRKKATAILEAKIAKLKAGAKIPKGVKAVAKFFSKKTN